MKKYSINDLKPIEGGTMFESVLPGLRIMKGGYNHLAPSVVCHVGEKHTHDVHEIFLCTQGRPKVPVVGGETASLSPGEFVVVEPGEEHHLTGDDRGESRLWFCLFDK